MLKKFISTMLSAAVATTALPAVINAEAIREIGETALVKVTEKGEGYIIVKAEDDREIMLNIGEETVMIDSKTKQSINAVEEGEKLLCEYSSVMTKSIPPQSSAMLIASNVEEGGNVELITADTVEKDEEGNLIVSDEAKDVELTISKSASVKPYKTKNIVRLDDIKEGSEILAWYDVTTLSLPAKAITENVVLLAEAADNNNETENEVPPVAIMTETTEKILADVTEKGEGYIIVKADDDREIMLNIGEETVMIDSKTKQSINAVEEGEKLLCEYSSVMTKSIPPQSSAILIASNVEEGGNVELITADAVEKDEEGNLIVSDEAKGVELTISKSASVKPYKTKNIVRLDDIKEGSKLLAWYDITTLSLPAKAYTENVVLLAETSEEKNEEDTDVSDWAKDDVEQAEKIGIFEGLKLLFKKDITREQFCELIYNILDKNGFIDKWREKGLPIVRLYDDTDNKKIEILTAMGMLSGKGDNKFAPNDLLTREEAARIISVTTSAIGLEEEKSEENFKYADDDNISDWAKGGVYSLRKFKIMSGTGDGFAPKTNITAEQAASMIMRIHRIVKR